MTVTGSKIRTGPLYCSIVGTVKNNKAVRLELGHYTSIVGTIKKSKITPMPTVILRRHYLLMVG